MIKQRGSPALHLLDRYLGIPTVAILGSLRRKRDLPRKIEHIGLLRTVAIGDTVLISAVIADLRVAFPKAEMTFFAGPSNFEVANLIRGIDRVVEVPIGNIIAGIRAIRSVPLDLMIDFGQWPRLEALLTLMSNTRFSIGFDTLGQHRHYVYDRVVKHSFDIHELDNYRRLVAAIGVSTGNLPALNLPMALRVKESDYAVLHLWPGGRRKELKRWPITEWLRLIEDFARIGLRVVLTGGASDSKGNTALISVLPNHLQGFVTNLAGISLQETIKILQYARLVVSVDTGVMHLAAVSGVPLVALHGPTASRRWGPVSDRAIAVDSPARGCGYMNLGWESRRIPPPCMESIRYETIRDTCFELLNKEREIQGDSTPAPSLASAPNARALGVVGDD